jgi:hypothetical protein
VVTARQSTLTWTLCSTICTLWDGVASWGNNPVTTGGFLAPSRDSREALPIAGRSFRSSGRADRSERRPEGV